MILPRHCLAAELLGKLQVEVLLTAQAVSLNLPARSRKLGLPTCTTARQLDKFYALITFTQLLSY